MKTEVPAKHRSKNGEKEIERRFKEYYELLCLVSFGIVRDRHTAKDVVQEFFISYWLKRDHISLTVSFKAYAIRAVKNLSLLSSEKAKNQRSLLQDLKALNYRERKASDGILESHKLEELMSRLPEGRRSIFMSFVVNGQSYSEIAENNGISVNTVKTQMKRAYAFLRKEATEDLLYLFVLAFYTTFL